MKFHWMGEHFRREMFCWQTWVVLASLLTLSFLLDHLWLLQYPGLRFMQSIDSQKTPSIAEHVVLVEIGSRDYQQRFNGVSPLDSKSLFKVIYQILLQGPRLVAVAIDTAHPSFRPFAPQVQSCNIIWGRGITLDEQPKPTGFLGFDSGDVRNAGIAVFPEDLDRGVRRLGGCVELDGTRMLTFHHAIASAFDRDSGETDSRCAEKVLPGRPYRFNVVTLDQLKRASGNAELPKPLDGRRSFCSAHPASRDSLFYDKIVLLGGNYSAGDRHVGPNGVLVPGVEIIASAVETELNSTTPSTAREILVDVTLELFLGIAVIFIYSLGFSLPLKLVTILILASTFLFVPGVLLYLFDFWTVNPILVIVGMMLHQMYEVNKRQHRHESCPGLTSEK